MRDRRCGVCRRTITLRRSSYGGLERRCSVREQTPSAAYPRFAHIAGPQENRRRCGRRVDKPNGHLNRAMFRLMSCACARLPNQLKDRVEPSALAAGRCRVPTACPPPLLFWRGSRPWTGRGKRSFDNTGVRNPRWTCEAANRRSSTLLLDPEQHASLLVCVPKPGHFFPWPRLIGAGRHKGVPYGSSPTGRRSFCVRFRTPASRIRTPAWSSAFHTPPRDGQLGWHDTC